VQLAYIPSPTRNVWHLGPVPLRAYAIAIIVGIALAVWIADRRWVARGGRPGTAADLAVWAVIFGLVGGRFYHVATDPELYFGEGRHPVDALKIWQGGLGIWGAIALGAAGAWIGARRKGISFAAFADAAAPGIAVAQAVGRLGNWFNNELYGRATTRPWGLTIYDIDPGTHRAREIDGRALVLGHFQPTFLYELVWNLGVAGVVVWADRRFRLGRGRAFALYAMAYTLGRLWIEALRVDHANHVLGVRLNIWTCAVVFLLALAWFVTHRGPREEVVDPAAALPSGPAGAEGRADADGADAAMGAAEGDAGDDGAGDSGGPAPGAAGDAGRHAAPADVSSVGGDDT
jgi:prolipoprotein diacylglyceryl transferase